MQSEVAARCSGCGYENSPQYHFCGMCGLALHHAEAVVAAPKPPAPLAVNRISLLGLENDTASPAKPSGATDYLLEEMQEPPSRHARMHLALAVLVAAGLLLAWNWHRDGYPWVPRFAQQPANAQTLQNSNPSAPAEAQAKPVETSPAAPPAAAPAEKTAATPAAPASAQATSEAASQTSSELEAQQAAPVAAVIAKPATHRPPMVEVATQQAASEHASKGPDENQLLVEGEKYLYGNGVAQDCDRAQKSLLAAAAHSSTAEDLLGTMYASGHCAARDLPTAYRWYARALRDDPTNTRIESDLKVLWLQMTPAERQLAGGK